MKNLVLVFVVLLLGFSSGSKEFAKTIYVSGEDITSCCYGEQVSLNLVVYPIEQSQMSYFKAYCVVYGPNGFRETYQLDYVRSSITTNKLKYSCVLIFEQKGGYIVNYFITYGNGEILVDPCSYRFMVW